MSNVTIAVQTELMPRHAEVVTPVRWPGVGDREWKDYLRDTEFRDRQLEEWINLALLRQTIWSFYSTPETEEMPPWVPRVPITIEAVSLATNDTATTATIADVNVDGTTVFSVTLGDTEEYVVTEVDGRIEVDPGELVTVQYDTIGDGLSNCTVGVWWRPRL
jgi:hypothetical protein